MTSQALASLRDRHVFVANELEKARDRIAALIPLSTGLTPSRCIAVVLDALSRDPALLECHGPSIVRTTLQATEVGLELGSPIGEAYLVPFWNGKKGRKEASLIIGYKGFVKLGAGTFDPPRLVRAGDSFEYSLGTAAEIHHKPGAGDIKQRGDVTAAYAIAHIGDRFVFDVMDRAELDKIRSAAKATRGPWVDHRDEMYRKCPVRRLAKYLDLNPLTKRAVEVDDLDALRRGDVGHMREGFDAGRAEELKAMLAAREKPQAVIDVDFEEAEEKKE